MFFKEKNNFNAIYLTPALMLLFFTGIMFAINSKSKFPEIYNGHIFLMEFGVFTFITYISTLILILTIYYKYFNDTPNLKDNPKRNALYLFLISLLFKFLLIGFGFEINDYSGILSDIFENGNFNDYKSYNYLALYISKMSSNYNQYLLYINIILGSLSISFLYLIMSSIKAPTASKKLIMTMVFLYIPITANESIPRVDTLYNFLFILSVYLTIKSTDKDNIRYIALLNVVLLISCFTREQTIYFLPLYIIFFIFSNLKNKSIAIISIIITVTSTSIFISNINKTNYGIDSKYRDFHLVVKLMQYGYLNQEVKDKYYNNLSSQSKALISDIEHEYKKNILPSKREKFQSKNFNLPFYYLIHPDNQNIYLKNNITPYKGNLELVKQKIKNKLFNGKKVISISDLSKRRDLINIDASIFPSLDNRNLFSYTTSILIDYYLIEENLCLENFKNNEAYVSSQCVLNILKGIDDTYLKNKSNNWMYTKAAFNIALSFDPNSKKYNQNQNIQSLKEIFLKYPYLYITQSLLTATSMTGAVYYNAISNKIINSTPIFRWILSKSQKYYRVIINLWYLFSLLNIFILYKYYKKSTIRRNNLLVSAIPLYYLIFISFATYAEFGRIILTAAPFIIFNFFQVILFISKNLGEASNHEVVKN